MMTYTHVTMDVSHAAYAEIMDKLVAAGYEHAIHNTRSDDGVVLDMHGIALKDEGKKEPRTVLDARRMCMPGDEPLA